MLEGANVKLGSVATRVLGLSGRAMVEALISGVTDPTELADLARGRLKSKHADLRRALRGVVGPHQRMLLAAQLRHVHYLDGEIDRLSQEIVLRQQPDEAAIAQLQTIPGVGRRTAEVILAEVGADLSRFPVSRPSGLMGRAMSWPK